MLLMCTYQDSRAARAEGQVCVGVGAGSCGLILRTGFLISCQFCSLSMALNLCSREGDKPQSWPAAKQSANFPLPTGGEPAPNSRNPVAPNPLPDNSTPHPQMSHSYIPPRCTLPARSGSPAPPLARKPNVTRSEHTQEQLVQATRRLLRPLLSKQRVMCCLINTIAYVHPNARYRAHAHRSSS